MRSLYLTTTCIFLFLGATPVMCAEPQWIEIRSPNFTIASDAGEKTARRIAWQFEQSRAMFVKLWPWASFDASRPFVVYAVRDERGMRALAPEYWEKKDGTRPASVSVSASDRHYIAIRTDQQLEQRDMNPYIASYWSYASIVITDSFRRDVPLWFSRGLSSVFSNTIVREGDILIGSIIPAHIRALRTGERLSLQQILGITRSSPYMTQADRMSTFDAAAWALVHYLIFGDEGRNTSRFNVFATALRRGVTQEAALAEGFGSLDTLARAFDSYVHKFAFVYRRLDLDVSIAPEKFPARPYSAPESAAVRAAFHVAMGRSGDARTLLDEALKAATPPALAFEVEGLYWDRQGDTGRARDAYARASELGEVGYFAAYRHALLAWPEENASDREDSLRRIEKSLNRAVSLNPASADAYTLLGQTAGALGDHERALGFARRAASLAPQSSHTRVVLADLLWNLGRLEAARVEARKALELAAGDAELTQARRLVEWMEQRMVKPAQPPAAPADDPNAPVAPVTVPDPNAMNVACGKGDAAACASLAPIAESACSSGNLQACAALAWILGSGSGVPADPERAAALYEKACAGGVKQACMNLALALARRGTKADLERAKALLADACNGNVPQACEMLKGWPK